MLIIIKGPIECLEMLACRHRMGLALAESRTLVFSVSTQHTSGTILCVLIYTCIIGYYCLTD